MKKFLSLLLSFIMVFSLSAPALAANSEATNDPVESTTVYLSNEVQLDIQVGRRAQINNTTASFEITQFNNGQLSRKVTLSDDGKFLLGTEYVDGIAVRNYSINLAERVQRCLSEFPNITPRASSKEYTIGYITYKPIIGETANERLRVYCDPYDTDNEPYVVNGKASDSFADIVGILFSIFLAYYFPVETLSEIVASTIVGFFGGKVAGNTIGVNFTENVSVIASYYNFRAYKYSTGIYSSIYSGVSRRVVTQKSKYYGDWFHEGITPSTWKNGDEFAIMCWNNMYNEYYPGVKSYT